MTAATRGILLVVMATACFAGMEVLAKALSRDLPIDVVIWARFTFSLLSITALMVLRKPHPDHGWWPRQPRLAFARGILLTICTGLFFTAISRMPLSTALSIQYVSPLIMTALSVPLLREHVGPRRWAAVGFGFVGMLLVVQPQSDDLGLIVLAPLAVAFFYALVIIITRAMRDNTDPICVLFWSTAVGSAAYSVYMPFVWVPPDLVHWLSFFGFAVLATGGHYFLIYAYRHGSASNLAPFLYVHLIWGTLGGLIVFGEVPNHWTLIGGGVIVVSGVYMYYRESVVGRRAARR